MKTNNQEVIHNKMVEQKQKVIETIDQNYVPNTIEPLLSSRITQREKKISNFFKNKNLNNMLYFKEKH